MGSGNNIIAERWVFRYCCGGFILLLLLVEYSEGELLNTLNQGDERRDEFMLTSPNGMFTLGVCTPDHTDYDYTDYFNTNYIGIWYGNDSSSPVWIANRNSPFSNHYGSTISLTLDANCSLKIVGNFGYNYSFSVFDVGKQSNSCYAVLQDDGNLVLQQGSVDAPVVLWQSFDHPTNTLLHGMKIGINHKTGFTWSLTSWTNWNSPRSGAFTLTINPNNTNQLLILLRGDVFWNSGNLQDGVFEFLQLDYFNQNQFEFNLVSNERETFFQYSSPNLYGSSPNRGLKLTEDGDLEWGNNVEFTKTKVNCPYFEDHEKYNSKLDGCVWKKKHEMPSCSNRSGNNYIPFRLKNDLVQTFQTSDYSYFKSENLTQYECKNMCLSDCDCFAYNLTNQDHSGCQLLSGAITTLIEPTDDGRAPSIFLLGHYYDYGYEYGYDPHLHFNDSGKMAVWLQATIGLIVPVIFLLLCFVIYVKWRTQVFKVLKNIKKSLLREKEATSEGLNVSGTMITQIKDGKKNPELHFFDFATIVSATNHFADQCKLGQGGFGPVYKGILTDGQEVAIKRLSKNSGQGLVEFKNETILIAKLQHTNLVRLIGCCIYKEEKLLVYEYMPNKSLDSFLFDLEKKLILDWKKRLHIIQGIVQGLLYLHYYSRVRVIHRDLKVSNILLDDEMNAKISDFGMARVFKPSEHEANTSRVIGTYGYISPEYAMEGIFSIKSDVYSFGILLLQIITSQKNYNNYDTERPLNLIGYAWELWVNGRGEELIDSGLCNNSDEKAKALRCIHVSLLCIQQIPAHRPTMLDVYFMINNDSAQLPYPKQPAFFVAQNLNPSKQELDVIDSALRPTAESAPEISSVLVMVAR